MQNRRFRYLFIAVAACLVAACTAAPRVTRLHQEQDAAGAPYGNVLVVAVFEDSQSRRIMERETRDRLTAAGIKAVALTSVQKPGHKLSREEVARAVEITSADAVLVTQLISYDPSVKAKHRSPEASYKFGTTYYFDVYTVDYKEFVEAPTVLLTGDLSLQTDLYSVESRSRVWAIKSEQKIKLNLEDRWDDSIVVAEAEAIVGALGRDRMIPR
ncbi:MAG: hypothetical protein AAFN78_15055 [Pseudomonadota bacterium]